MKRTIKTLLIAIIAVLAYSSASAQKIGYVQFDSLIVLMPEWDTAQMKIKKRSDNYQKQMDEMYNELQKKQLDYQKAQKDPNMTQTLLDLKGQGIQDLQSSIQRNEQALQQELVQYQNELVSKIADKVKVAVEAVAKEKGYVHVLDKSAFVYSSPGDNLMEPVKKKLGLK